MKTFLLVDTSYCIFFRFFATKTWYGFANPEDKFEDGYSWIDNQIFKKSFIKNFFKGFLKMIKKYEIDENNIIFTIDCNRKDIWRNKYFNKYKANREGKYGSSPGQIDIGPYFIYTYENILPNLVKDKNCKIVKFNNLEADDVIYLTKLRLRELYPDCNIIVITSDHDMLQIIDDNTKLISLKNKMLNDKSCGDPKKDLEIKVICGDKSDNIAGCFKRCGIKTAMKCIENRLELEKQFKKNPGSLDIYALNKILVDFKNIPTNLVESFNKYILDIEL